MHRTIGNKSASLSGSYAIMLLLLLVCSCNFPGHSPENNPFITDPANKHFTDSLSREIHRLLHEQPSLAREKTTYMLDTMQKNNPVLEIMLLKHTGSSFVLEAQYNEALKYYNIALGKAEEIRLYSEMASINNNIGVIYNYVGNLKSSFMHFNEALNYYELTGRQAEKIGTINNIGLIYLHLGNYEKAISQFEEALHMPTESKDTVFLVSARTNLAICYFSIGELETSREHLQEAIMLSQKINNMHGLCISYKIMGDIYLSQDQTEEALEAFTRSADIAQQGNLTFQHAISLLGIAKAYLQNEKTHEAFAIANTVMEMAIEHDNLVFENESHQVLSDIYYRNNDFENSLKHFREHNRTMLELSNQTIMHQIYDIELSNLSNLNKMQQLELEKQELAMSKQNTLFFFTSLTFVLLFAGFYLIYLNLRHRQKMRLQSTVIELTQKQSHAAMEAEIQERKRIGQELHDSLGHLLSLAGLHASLLHRRREELSPEKKDQVLESLLKTIDDAFSEVRTISHNLAPSLLSERGLRGALKSISDKVNQTSNLKMSYKTYGLNDKLDSLIENTLFRTIQEIVNNAIKHSEASKLFIQITQGTNEITLMAEDNGKGFEMEMIQHFSGNGLSHMKSRIENLRGNIFVDSNPNRGTIVSILIPLR